MRGVCETTTEDHAMSQIDCKINIMCIELMITDCRNNTIHCKINDIRIAGPPGYAVFFYVAALSGQEIQP